MWAVVPVKPLDRAKQRLAPALSESGRRRLARAMLEDVLETLSATTSLDGVLVVTSDPQVHTSAQQYGFDLLAEPEAEEGGGPEAQLNAALEAASLQLQQLSADSLLVVPADVPLLRATDVEALHQRSQDRERQVLLVADRRRAGTNALLVRPPGAIPFRFGVGSPEQHRLAASESGVPFNELHLPSLRLDIDTPEDLLELARLCSRTRTGSLLEKLQLSASSPARRPKSPARRPKSQAGRPKSQVERTGS